MLLAHIEMWVEELEREVQAFEDAVEEVERVMCEAEDSILRGEDGQKSQEQSLYQLHDALQSADRVAELVCAANATLLEALDAAQQITQNEGIEGERPVSLGLASAQHEINPAKTEPLFPGAVILQGRYRITQLLHTRPRVNLYLGYRLPAQNEQQAEQAAPALVAIRELTLAGLSPQQQQLVEHAAFEEFVSPVMFGSPRLPGVGDRVSIERERHYLVMQLRPTRGVRQAVAVPLEELLLTHRRWPGWLNMETALEWGVQLCRIVARLHRMGCIIGDLDPATILVDNDGASNWAPVLLVCWPPALQFWPAGFSRDDVACLFPPARMNVDNVFAAPEMLQGRCDERSDVYALGAILYLLFTRYAPVSPVLRLASSDGSRGTLGYSGTSHAREGMRLVPPHLLNNRISSRLESILTRALALHPAHRFSSAFALVEALESIDPSVDFADPFVNHHQRARYVSRVSKVFGWGRRDSS